ncbi:sensor histidine kinase [Streptosporangium minutum]|uniref:sensor histidine kinase n=1 Tax=Streptosporangium minutum TaxID=569862 RepID=UPI0013FDF5DD|nr:histidine kinase [Streptosporangium minutum]
MRESPSPAGAAMDSFLNRHQVSADAILAVLLVLPLGLVSLGLLRASDSPLSSRLLAGLGLLVLHACVVPRRLRPLAAYGLAAAAMLLLVALPPLNDPGGAYYPAVLLPSTLVFGLLLYTASGRLDLLPSLVCLAVALTGVVLVLARLWNPASWGGSSGSYELAAWRIGLSVGLIAAAVCLWSLGRLSRMRGLFLSQLRAKAERAEADRARERKEAARAERDRISREMHDVVSHSLAVMVSQAEGGRLSDPDSPGAGVFATIAGVGREALRDMRGLLGVLRADGGTAPQPGLDDLSDLLDHVRDAGVRVAVQEVGDSRPLRPAVDLTAFRVIQEGLTNVIKHAGATAAADMTLTWRPDGLHITITNDGDGPLAEEAGVGLTGMRERLSMVGGVLEAGRRPGAGFELSATVPYEPRSLPSSGS